MWPDLCPFALVNALSGLLHDREKPLQQGVFCALSQSFLEVVRQVLHLPALCFEVPGLFHRLFTVRLALKLRCARNK
ncbi:hypothetical protein PSAC2689_110272 [Paraburkholderia sacchari]